MKPISDIISQEERARCWHIVRYKGCNDDILRGIIYPIEDEIDKQVLRPIKRTLKDKYETIGNKTSP